MRPQVVENPSAFDSRISRGYGATHKGESFVGDKEKAAKWDRIEEYKKAKERLAALQGELHAVGENYEGIGRELKKRPDNVDLSVMQTLISGAGVADLIEEFKTAELNFGRLSDTIRGLGVEPF